MTSSQLRKQIILYCKRLDQKGFVTNHDGNLSVRLNDRFLATPTARAKFGLTESDLIVVDESGQTKSGSAKIFGEWELHREIYQNRSDLKAIVHAHAPFASAFGLSGQPFRTDFWPEAVVSLGRFVPCVQNKEQVGLVSRQASACLMQGNGIFAWGDSLEQAYLRLELVEHLVHIYTLALPLGNIKQLTPEQVTQLLDKRKKAGLMAPEELHAGKSPETYHA